jgi:LPXTG-motif cell wall-anchored protein
MKRRSRRRTNRRRPVALTLICSSVVVGIIGGLSLNMANSESIHKNSTVTVEVMGNNTQEEGNQTGKPGKPKPPVIKPTVPGHDGNGTETNGNGTTMSGHGTEAGSHFGLQSQSNVNNPNNPPSVIVDKYGRNKLPQTGNQSNNLAVLGAGLMGALLMIPFVKNVLQKS